MGRAIQLGKKITATLNMPFMLSMSFRHEEKNYLCYAASVAKCSMNVAYRSYYNTIQNSVNKFTECGMFLGGSWQHQGYRSFNSVVKAISALSGKILDIATIS
ncbi:hypothetical protein NPIL_126601 [Nephila pilipes]|uniref:Mutator-like transposase domain-containing protein n=1 Tax=Nephila pilipes TaxID=299642 RepID=A0A8X6T6V5_NEPPI|nr:hypothetical protein NPIL_126601 [Nephila pilipes]